MLISPKYAEMNRELHANSKGYGEGQATRKHYQMIEYLAQSIGASSVLDYGCGKGVFGQAYPHLLVTNYDPAIEEFSTRPEPADLVVCLDVAEHVEPECIPAFLDDLKSLTVKSLFLTISTRPAKRILSDGRNAHLIQEGPGWWLPKILERFSIRHMNYKAGEIVVVATNKAEAEAGELALREKVLKSIAESKR